MDNIVIVLIGAGVCCFVVGIALFLKLCKSTPAEDAGKALLDPEYAENFKECFDNTDSIEDTLEELSNIYMGNQYMYNLIINALEYIRDGQGDYETALDGINVDDDKEIMKLHNMAIRRTLEASMSNLPSESVEKITDHSESENNTKEEFFEEDEMLEETENLETEEEVDEGPIDDDDLGSFKIG